jgi:hypothetical protein
MINNPTPLHRYKHKSALVGVVALAIPPSQAPTYKQQQQQLTIALAATTTTTQTKIAQT